MTSTPAWLTQRSESGECWWCRLETAVRSEPFAQAGELVGRPVSGLKPRALTRLGPRQRPGHLGVRAGSRLRDRDQGCRLRRYGCRTRASAEGALVADRQLHHGPGRNRLEAEPRAG